MARAWRLAQRATAPRSARRDTQGVASTLADIRVRRSHNQARIKLKLQVLEHLCTTTCAMSHPRTHILHPSTHARPPTTPFTHLPRAG